MSLDPHDTTAETGVTYDPCTGDYMIRLEGTLLGYAPSESVGQERLLNERLARASHTFHAPLDAPDLAQLLSDDASAAYAQLAALSPLQLLRQALAHATYLNERDGLDLSVDDILATWQRRLAHSAMIAA